MIDSMQNRTVELSVPAHRDMMLVLRLTTAGVVARAGLGVDRINDVKMAVEEACALIIETALKKEPGEEKKTIDWKSPGMIHVYIMLGIVVGFVVLMKIVGMLLALLIMIPAIEYLMGCRSKVMLIALPVGMVAFVYLFFVVAMKLTLPAPIWA